MKRVPFTVLLLVLFLSLTPSALSEGDTEGPSANGSFKISIANGQSREIQFNARVASDGSAAGQITFRDTEPVGIDRRATTGFQASEASAPFYAKVICDCLVVKGVEAVLSGTVTESDDKNYIGRRVLLVVQDGDSLNPPLRDKLTFGFYGTKPKFWVASDAERPDEQGPAPAWVATDAERVDDTGVLSLKREEVTCESFPISSYSFISAKQGKGKIQVTR